MRTAYLVIVVCGIGIFVCGFLDQIRPSLLGTVGIVICILGLMTALIASFVFGLVSWRKLSRWWMGPALLCIAFLLGIRISGNMRMDEAIGDWWFKKHMAPYVKIVDSIQNGAVSYSPNFTRINDITNLPPHIRYVSAARCSDGSVLVEFRIKTSFPLSPIGYLFKNYAETNNCITANMGPEHHWHYLRHITGNWYRFGY
jgi:hypothetical protein